MKVVILAGGKGRLLEFTKKIPKPMVPIKKTYNNSYYETLCKVWI